MKRTDVADSKERNELRTGILYPQRNYFQKGDDDRVYHDDVHDHEMCDGDHDRDYAGCYDNELPSSATYRALSPTIHS